MVAPILSRPARANRSDPPRRLARYAWLALFALACGEPAAPNSSNPSATAPTPAPEMESSVPTPLLVGNELRNPSFEAGSRGWKRQEGMYRADFDIVNEPVHSGRAAARLVADWQPGERERSVALLHATQEISPPRFPDRVGGWYRVERWEDAPDPGALQLQVIVFAIGDPRTREIVQSLDPDGPEVPPELDNLQLRYQLAGPSEAPEDGGNIKNRVIGKGPPMLASWVHFDLPLKSDFEERWGTLPANYRELRVMFIVRWDDKPKGVALHADVYFDDLFFGFNDL